MIPTFLILAVFVGLGLAAFDLLAAVGGRETTTWSVLTYVWIGLWGGLGGMVSFAQKVKAGQARWLNLGELFGEIFISAFVGIVTGLLCEAASIGQSMTWALVAVSGHAGGRAIFWGERVLQKVAEKQFGVSVGDVQGATPQRGTPADGS